MNILSLYSLLHCIMQGRKAAKAGDIEAAKQKFKFSRYCNIASVVGGVFSYIMLIVGAPVAVIVINEIVF